MNKPDKSEFKYLSNIATRWNDNDIYGHINNIVYYSFFDTAVNKYLIEEAGLNIHDAEIVAYVVNSSCNYFSSLSYPEQVQVGVAVSKLGNSSVTYKLGIFKSCSEEAFALGEFVHVFVNRTNHTSVPIPKNIREKLQDLVI